MKIIGIYKIVNKTNGKYYVGSSNNVWSRINYHHKKLLREGNHWNIHLQNAWNKCGEQAFDFLIIEEFDFPKSYVEIWKEEQKWLDIARMEQNKCYNKSFTAGGVDFTPEVRHKMSVAAKRWISENGHPNLGKHPSEDTLRKQSESHKGKKLSSSAKEKISGENSVAHRQSVKQAKQNWWKQLKNDPEAYSLFCKSRGEKSKKARLLYAKNYEIISD